MRQSGSGVLQKPAAAYEARGRLDPQGFQRHVQFAAHAPPVDLTPFVEHFWTIRWDLDKAVYSSPEVMHRPYVDLFISAEQSGIQGTFRGRRSYLAAGSGRIVGTRFRPGAFHALWSGDLAALEEKFVDLETVFPAVDDGWIADLLALDDAAAVQRLAALVRAAEPVPDSSIELINEIVLAVEADERLTTVAAVAEAFGRSERWLQQLFRDYVGLGLKWLLQRHRLLAAAQLIREADTPDWAAIAYDLGYSSQQHFITDFRKVLGTTPTAYRREIGD